VRSFPYDRERTSMADFTMCPRCENEYKSPEDRRFHSQTNSCPDCGPGLVLVDAQGVELPGDPALGAIDLLIKGRILAVKGIGGFHLACNALDESAVNELRSRKGRGEKPFAVMMSDLPHIKDYCDIAAEEERLLSSPVAPIVLVKANGKQLAPSIAPSVGTLGVMLPYTPIHHLLFKHSEAPLPPEALVMTSGNRSEEPPARDNDEALNNLGDIADAFLLHNREIVLRADDSIFRVIADKPVVFRRSRGIVPEALVLPPGSGDQVVLGAGGDIKNCLCVLKGGHAIPGPHVGDLATTAAQDYFARSIQVLTDYLDVKPELAAVDPHPEYFSSSLAADKFDAAEVYHHHAHAVSLLVEHKSRGPALFAVFDGTGYGTDGTIWGGEFLLADAGSFTRVGMLSVFALPGGEAAVRFSLRILAGLLGRTGPIPNEMATLFGSEFQKAQLWAEAGRKNINAPLTSSAGRLFDAAAACAGFRRAITFEGQAAMWFEAVADPEQTGYYPTAVIQNDDMLIADSEDLIKRLAADILNGRSESTVAAKFHNSVAGLICDVLVKTSERHGIDLVGLTGGCFQNKLLTERTARLLENAGLTVMLHRDVPPNDGGIAVGQAFSARMRARKQIREI
jgi:hydrogenase maturation protein HypF